MEGVVAKRRDSRYRPGTRSRDWIKVKAERTQEVVIGGWTTGQGNRSSAFGALAPRASPTRTTPSRLRFVGKVGTGFDAAALDDLLARLEQARRGRPARSPSACPPGRERWPGGSSRRSVGEVRYTEWTGDGRLAPPSLARAAARQDGPRGDP